MGKGKCWEEIEIMRGIHISKSSPHFTWCKMRIFVWFLNLSCKLLFIFWMIQHLILKYWKEVFYLFSFVKSKKKYGEWSLLFCGFVFIKYVGCSPLFWLFAPVPSGKYFSKYPPRLLPQPGESGCFNGCTYRTHSGNGTYFMSNALFS